MAIVDINKSDIREHGNLALKVKDKTIESHMRLAEIRLKKEVGENYTDDQEILRMIKILFTLITLLPIENVIYSEGMNKAKEKGSEYRTLTPSQVKVITDKWEIDAKDLLEDIVLFPSDDTETDDDTEDYIDEEEGSFRMSVNTGDTDQIDLTTGVEDVRS